MFHQSTSPIQDLFLSRSIKVYLFPGQISINLSQRSPIHISVVGRSKVDSDTTYPQTTTKPTNVINLWKISQFVKAYFFLVFNIFNFFVIQLPKGRFLLIKNDIIEFCNFLMFFNKSENVLFVIVMYLSIRRTFSLKWEILF